MLILVKSYESPRVKRGSSTEATNRKFKKGGGGGVENAKQNIGKHRLFQYNMNEKIKIINQTDIRTLTIINGLLLSITKYFLEIWH